MYLECSSSDPATTAPPGAQALAKTTARRRRITPEDLRQFISVADPQISPDGNRVLLTRSHVGAKNETLSYLWIVEADGSVRVDLALEADDVEPSLAPLLRDAAEVEDLALEEAWLRCAEVLRKVACPAPHSVVGCENAAQRESPCAKRSCSPQGAVELMIPAAVEPSLRQKGDAVCQQPAAALEVDEQPGVAATRELTSP